jgi:hypothetical protein
MVQSMQNTTENIKSSYGDRSCFNKKTGKIGYLATRKLNESKGNFYYFNVEQGQLTKLDSQGRRVLTVELWNINDVSIRG